MPNEATPANGATTAEATTRPAPVSNLFAPLRLARVAVAGVLMGTANLIPGVSGGTMVLAMGLYQEFIDSVAEFTAFRWSVRRIVFLGVLGFFALAAIAGLAWLILYLLFHYPTAMFALFIGLTLGGAPTLMRSLRPIRIDVVIATLAGIGLMIGVLLLKHLQGGGMPHNTVMDFFSGIVGATTMVLPGVSGSYMLLVLEQYERVVGAINPLNLRIVVPVGIGAVAGIVGLSHILKFLLNYFQRATVGVLLGILLGSVVGLWPFSKQPGEEALERRGVAELRTFAEKWQIAAALAADDGSDSEQNQLHLMHAILEGWADRGQSSYSAGRILTAVICVVAGFLVTLALGRRPAAAGSGASSSAGSGSPPTGAAPTA
jgi:putative membrane protein